MFRRLMDVVINFERYVETWLAFGKRPQKCPKCGQYMPYFDHLQRYSCVYLKCVTDNV